MQQKQMTIFLSEGEQLTDFLLRQVNERCQGRYRLIHLAEDAKLRYNQLWRFTNGHQVNQQFINDLFNYFVH
jgi:hypothetical protein